MHKVEPTPPSEMRRYQMVTIGYDPFTLMSVCLPLGNRRSAAWCVDAAQLIAESVRRGGGYTLPIRVEEEYSLTGVVSVFHMLY